MPEALDIERLEQLRLAWVRSGSDQDRESYDAALRASAAELIAIARAARDYSRASTWRGGRERGPNG